jgi:hypothetical protein
MTMTTPSECNNRLLNTIINNIFVIPWNPVLLMEETRVPQKKKKIKNKKKKKIK